jgi:hypothetical protein
LDCNFQPRSLNLFCSQVVSGHTAHWPPSEQRLAEEFGTFFGLASLRSFEGLVRLCGSLGIEVPTAALPKELRGYHHWYGEKLAILIADGEGSYLWREHTLLHELREMLEHVFRELGRPTTEASMLESRAEEFAVQARLTASWELWSGLFENAEKVESKWRRWGTYALIGFGALLMGISFVFLPQLEDRITPAGLST